MKKNGKQNSARHQQRNPDMRGQAVSAAKAWAGLTPIGPAIGMYDALNESSKLYKVTTQVGREKYLKFKGKAKAFLDACLGL